VNGHDPNGAMSQVIIRSEENPSAQVRLHDCRFAGEYETTFAVDLHADGLDAHIDPISVTPWDNGGLTDFMDELAADFRGWGGTRSWTTNHLKLTATFHPGGHVELCWTIRLWITRNDWEASLTTWIEGGQQMTELAAAIKAFLTQTQPVQLRRRLTQVRPIRRRSRTAPGDAVVIAEKAASLLAESTGGRRDR
jgi:hypothetical protein